MLYVDTSVLVAALTNEAGAGAARAALTTAAVGDLALSDWTETEFSSALAMKLRMGQIDRAARAAVLAGFTRLVADSFQVLPVGPQDFLAAARLCDRDDLGLRAGDALHLAVAMGQGAKLVSLDRALIRAGQIAGVDVLDPAAV